MILSIPLILAFVVLWKIEDEDNKIYLGWAVTLGVMDMLAITLSFF